MAEFDTDEENSREPSFSANSEGLGHDPEYEFDMELLGHAQHAATEHVNRLSAEDVKEMVELDTVLVKKIVEALAISIGLEPVKSTKGRRFLIVSQRAAKEMVRAADFLDKLITSPKISLDGLRALKNYITDPLLVGDAVKKISATATVLWNWVRHNFAYKVKRPLAFIIRERKHERRRNVTYKRHGTGSSDDFKALRESGGGSVYTYASDSEFGDLSDGGSTDSRTRKKSMKEVRARLARRRSEHRRRLRKQSTGSSASERKSMSKSNSEKNLPRYMQATKSQQKRTESGKDYDFKRNLRGAVPPSGSLNALRQNGRALAERVARDRHSRGNGMLSSRSARSAHSQSSLDEMDEFKSKMSQLSDKFDTEMAKAFRMIDSVSTTSRKSRSSWTGATPRFMQSTTSSKLRLDRDEPKQEVARPRSKSVKNLDWASFMEPTAAAKKRLEKAPEEEELPPAKKKQASVVEWASFMRETSSSKKRVEPEPKPEPKPMPKIPDKPVEWAPYMAETDTFMKKSEIEEEAPKPKVPTKQLDWAEFMKGTTIQDYRSGKKEVPKSTGWNSSVSSEKPGGILAQYSIKPMGFQHKRKAKSRAQSATKYRSLQLIRLKKLAKQSSANDGSRTPSMNSMSSMGSRQSYSSAGTTNSLAALLKGANISSKPKKAKPKKRRSGGPSSVSSARSVRSTQSTNSTGARGRRARSRGRSRAETSVTSSKKKPVKFRNAQYSTPPAMLLKGISAEELANLELSELSDAPSAASERRKSSQPARAPRSVA